jgi:hypothetical protein
VLGVASSIFVAVGSAAGTSTAIGYNVTPEGGEADRVATVAAERRSTFSPIEIRLVLLRAEHRSADTANELH